jgi:tRNA nucleotidyltransferase (CCA-adding enzyme)
VDPGSVEIIGIVTRTDLIKTFSTQPRLPDAFQMISRLEASLPVERLALLKAISNAAAENRIAVYLVGGFVRDLLLDQPSQDFDLVVEGDAIQLTHFLVKRWGGRVTSHSQFGTAKWHLVGSNFYQLDSETPLNSIDLVSARTEFYTHPTALPTVERSSIKLDLHRRDFTINTLALRLDGRHYGEIHDYWGGMNDLSQGLVRVLHSLSFVEDPTRILRAVRFEQRFSFVIERRTLELAMEDRHLIDRLSGDRVRHELDHILIEPFAGQVLHRLDSLSFLKAIHPLLTWDEWLDKRFSMKFDHLPGPEWDLEPSLNNDYFCQQLGYCLLMIRLKVEEARGICNRLKFSARMSAHITGACELFQKMPDLIGNKPSVLVGTLDDTPSLARFAVYIASLDPEVRRIFERYNTEWKLIQPGLNGNDLIKLGITPGPVYKDILGRIKNAWLDGEVQDSQQEHEFLNNLIQTLGKKNVLEDTI